MKQYKIQNRSQQNSHSCVPLIRLTDTKKNFKNVLFLKAYKAL
jgi:hypothetical protein